MTLPIEVETATTFALRPVCVVTSINFGSLLKLNPLDVIFTLPILPLIALEDLVAYSNVLVSLFWYERTLGSTLGE